MTPLLAEDVRRLIGAVPHDIKTLMREHRLCLAGGSVRAILAGESVADFDLFAPPTGDVPAVAARLAHLRGGDSVVVSTQNAITVATTGRTPAQFVARWRFDDPDAVIRHFDFTVCQAVLWFSDGAWTARCSDLFYPDLAAKRLRYTVPPPTGRAAGASLLRMCRYLRRGYSIQPESLAALVAAAVAEASTVSEGLGAALLANLREVDPLMLVDGMPNTPPEDRI